MITKDWDSLLNKEVAQIYFKNMILFLKKEYEVKNIFPPKQQIFNALKSTDFNNVKVVIIGQDPYHGYGQAHGYAFSVNGLVKRPPSLNNIFKELEYDLGIIRESNNLEDWSLQGVLLLNTILTVEENKPLSHKNIGWEIFTNKIIELLNASSQPIVFILWGSQARSKKYLITNNKHCIIESAHPSPLSAHAGFFGSKPFSKANQFLIDNHLTEIKW